MAFREVSAIAIREVLRLWVRGTALRRITALTGGDRKSADRWCHACWISGRTLTALPEDSHTRVSW